MSILSYHYWHCVISNAIRITKDAIQGPVVRSLISANCWLRGIKTYRFPWYLTLVSANHASSNPGQNYFIYVVLS